MRILISLCAVALFLAGCRGSEPYTALDYRQIRQGYAELLPTYKAFRKAYKAGDAAGIQAAFRREQSQCHLVDAIDERDTIDPNINLFQASGALDTLCNEMETAHAMWAKRSGLRYDKTLVLVRPSEVFLGSEAVLKKIKKEIRHPKALA